jgi:hypothetical protein
MSCTTVDSIREIPLSMIPIDWAQADPSKVDTLMEQLEAKDEQYQKLEQERQIEIEAIKKSSTAANSSDEPGQSVPKH